MVARTLVTSIDRNRGKFPGSCSKPLRSGRAALRQEFQMTRFSSSSFLMLHLRAR